MARTCCCLMSLTAGIAMGYLACAYFGDDRQTRHMINKASHQAEKKAEKAIKHMKTYLEDF